MPRKDPTRSGLCVLRHPTAEQRAQLQAKAADRTLVFRAGLLTNTIEGDGVQAWFAARHPETMDVIKVRATWMQSNILNVGCGTGQRWSVGTTSQPWVADGKRSTTRLSLASTRSCNAWRA
mmetsp:Transcript_26093/g.59276  ORF Transcript_26093/g.59276 Transcript_26093/m.59276 type:complete len:121 (-) Transcript_26093:256-618(-)